MATISISKNDHNNLLVTANGAQNNLSVQGYNLQESVKKDSVTLSVKAVGLSYDLDLYITDTITLAGVDFNGTSADLRDALNSLMLSTPRAPVTSVVPQATNYQLAQALGLPFANGNKQVVTLAADNGLMHGFTYANGKLFGACTTYPFSLYRFNNLNDLNDYTRHPITTEFSSGRDLIYIPRKDRLYLSLDNATAFTVTEIHPVTFNEIVRVSLPYGTYSGSGIDAIAFDENFLYVLFRRTSTNPAALIKVNMATWAVAMTADITGCLSAHAMRHDGTHLYITTSASPAKIFKINPVDLTTILTVTFAVGDNIATDEMCFAGDYVWVGLEALNGFVLRIKKSDLSITRINTTVASGSAYCTFFDGRYVWAAMVGTPGSLVRIDPETLAVLKHTLDTGENSPNEIATDGHRLFLTCYINPGKVIRLSSFVLA